MRDTPPTKSAELQLKEERQIVRQGFGFLDEKRMLLAAELIRELDDYASLRDAYLAGARRAAAALEAAVVRHGIDNLQVYPSSPLSPTTPKISRRSFLGIPLTTSDLRLRATEPAFAPVDASSEAEECRAAFRQLVELATRLACAGGNLHRLAAEYRKTEQRARALENIILPEIQEELKHLADQLEMLEQEEIIRVRLADRAVRGEGGAE